ncbi:MAG: hypothetical protein KQH63_12100 [Desulfobulbaceae bacterium]|nr:hypothetical protein [Desulfobulbaceae bacterium]
MKKVLRIAALTGLVVASGVAQAQAAAVDYYDNLIRVVYNTDQKEIVSNLGAINTLPMDTQLGVGQIDLAGWNAGTTYADLTVGYFGFKATKTGIFTTDYDYYMTSSRNDLTLADINTSYTASFATAFTSVASLMNGAVTEIDPADSNSYTNVYNVSGLNFGGYAGLLRDGSGEANLADLATGGVTELFLYHIDKTSGVVSLENLDTMIITGADYTETTAPSAVPVPGAVWLLGAGLMSIAGLKRKNENA